MLMFNDFNYKYWLGNIDNLIREGHYGSFVELENMTIRELSNIFNIIISKQQEEALAKAKS